MLGLVVRGRVSDSSWFRSSLPAGPFLVASLILAQPWLGVEGHTSCRASLAGCGRE